MSRPRRRISFADLVMIGVLAAAVGGGLAAQVGTDRGHRALVQIDGETELRLNLHRDGTHQVRGPAGESRIEVTDGRVRIVEAPCRRKLCLRRGWLSTAGESATCLPNRLHLQVEGREQRYDAINH